MNQNIDRQFGRRRFIAVALAGISSLAAQAPPGGGFHHGGNMDFMAHEMGAKTVKGAPFAADTVTTTTQTLSNGTHVARSVTASIYRDSEGRTRREETLGAMGALASSGASRKVVLIHDPVAGAAYVLNPGNHTARQMAFNPRHGVGRQSGSTAASQDAAVAGNSSPESRDVQRLGGTVNTESLGRQVIEGIEVVGTRRTVSIPVGAIGNDQAIQSVIERWYSPDLQITVKSVRTDPRFGQTVYQVSNIRRSEQPSTLFTVPSDYTVQAAGHQTKAAQ